MWYPCSEPPEEIDFGPTDPPGLGVKDCPISREGLSLVVVSHGCGGASVNHHDLAETLADAGFIVAAINHPRDRAPDKNRSGDLPVFVVRVKDDAGDVTERKYKLNTPIVRRVLAPGEQKESSVVSHRSSARAKKKR